MDEFTRRQQEILDQELAEMLPKEVNDLLSTMKPGEANVFLECLGRLRALQIYTSLLGCDRTPYFENSRFHVKIYL